MKYLILLCLILLSGCASSYNSWLIKDNGTNSCYYLYDTPLYIDNQIHWYSLTDKRHQTSTNFDLQVVHNEDYVKAAQKLHINLLECSNGLK